jgi:putative transposase
VSNEQVKEWPCELITAEGFAYGYLKLTHCLRRKFNLVYQQEKGVPAFLVDDLHIQK